MCAGCIDGSHRRAAKTRSPARRGGRSHASLKKRFLRAITERLARRGAGARAHKELLGDNPPASTLVEVRALVNPAMLVEIEADVFAGGKKASHSEAPKMTASKAAASRAAVKSKAPAKKTSSKTSSRK